MQGVNRKISAIEFSSQHSTQQQQVPSQVNNLQGGPQYSSISVQQTRVQTQNSPCRMATQNTSPYSSTQQIPQQQILFNSKITPIRQRGSQLQHITQQSLNSISLSQSGNQPIPLHPPIHTIQGQKQVLTPHNHQSNQPIQQLYQTPKNLSRSPQKLNASSKPFSQIPEKHRLLQQKSKNLTNNNNSSNILSNKNIEIEEPSKNLENKQNFLPIQGSISSSYKQKIKSEMNLPNEYFQTPLQHIQTISQMANADHVYKQITSPLLSSVSRTKKIINYKQEETLLGTPVIQNLQKKQIGQLDDFNVNNSQGFPNINTNSTNNLSLPQTVLKNSYKIQTERESSPYNLLRQQLSTNQKTASPNIQNSQSSNIGLSNQNLCNIPCNFTDYASQSANAGINNSANRRTSNVTSSPQNIPQSFLKQNYQNNNQGTSNPNSNSFIQISLLNQPQITKQNSELIRSNSCNNMRNQYQNKNNLKFDYIDKSERVNTIGTEFVEPKRFSINNPITPIRQSRMDNSSPLQMSQINSNSKKLRDLEEQIKDLVNENTKMSQLLEEKGYLLQQLQDEKIVQKLLMENQELKEKVRKLTIDNDLTIQNRMLHTENTNLNKILCEKVTEIRELKDIIQNKTNSGNQNIENVQKINELEQNIQLLIQENDQIDEVLMQSQVENKQLKENITDQQKRIVQIQSQLKESQERNKDFELMMIKLKNLEQQNHYLEINSVQNEKYIELKNEFDQITKSLAMKQQEISQIKLQHKKINKESEDQIAKLVEENEKLNDIISQYVNSSSDILLNSSTILKNNTKMYSVKEGEEEKLIMYEQLQNLNKDYEDKIASLINQNKSLEEIICDFEKEKDELNENLQFMEQRLKEIEKENAELLSQQQIKQKEIELKSEDQCTHIIEATNRIQELEQQYKILQDLQDKTSSELNLKLEELSKNDEIQQEIKQNFDQTLEEKLQEINRLNQQIQKQSEHIESLQQTQEQESRKKSSNQRLVQNYRLSPNPIQEEQSQENSKRSSFISEKDANEEIRSSQNEVNKIQKYQEELKEKNDIIKNLNDNLDFQQEQACELNEHVQSQAIQINQQQEQIKKQQIDIDRKEKKIMELLQNIVEQRSQKMEKSNEFDKISQSQFSINDLVQQVEFKENLLHEQSAVIRVLEENIINLQKQLKELKPNIELDASSLVNIQRLESQILLSPQISPRMRQDRKQIQLDDKLIQLQQNGDQSIISQKGRLLQNQQNYIEPQQVQQIIEREIYQFDQKYKDKIEDLEREMYTSLNEREGKIIDLVNENQKLLQLNEQRLIELKILNQQIDKREEQSIKDTKTIEELQKKVQMLLSKNLQINKGISKNTSFYQQSSSERSLIDSIQEEESEESQEIIDNQKQQSINVTFEIQKLQKKLEEKRKLISRFKSEMENLKEKLLDYEEIEFRLTSENRQLQEEVRSLQSQSEDYKKLNDLLKTRKNEYNELKKRFEALRKERDEILGKLKSRSQELSPSSKNQKSLLVDSSELQQEIEKQKKENEELKKFHDQIIVQIKKKEKELAEKSEELDQIINKCNELTDQLSPQSAPNSYCTYDIQQEMLQKSNSALNI